MYNFIIKVGHLLSEFAIEFASELSCRILLSKVTRRLRNPGVKCESVDDQPYHDTEN